MDSQVDRTKILCLLGGTLRHNNGWFAVKMIMRKCCYMNKVDLPYHSVNKKTYKSQKVQN